jgi:hypothetical protein
MYSHTMSARPRRIAKAHCWLCHTVPEDFCAASCIFMRNAVLCKHTHAHMRVRAAGTLALLALCACWGARTHSFRQRSGAFACNPHARLLRSRKTSADHAATSSNKEATTTVGPITFAINPWTGYGVSLYRDRIVVHTCLCATRRRARPR